MQECCGPFIPLIARFAAFLPSATVAVTTKLWTLYAQMYEYSHKLVNTEQDVERYIALSQEFLDAYINEAPGVTNGSSYGPQGVTPYIHIVVALLLLWHNSRTGVSLSSPDAQLGTWLPSGGLRTRT